MTARLKLSEAVEQLDFQPDETRVCFNKVTGELVSLPVDELSPAEDLGDEEFEELIEESPKWQQESLRVARQVAGSGDWFLPSKHDVHEWNIMRDFALAQDEETCNALMDALHGTGAFRMFKHSIRLLKKQDEWDAFKANALEQIVIDWCESSGIEYIDE